MYVQWRTMLQCEIYGWNAVVCDESNAKRKNEGGGGGEGEEEKEDLDVLEAICYINFVFTQHAFL